MSEGQLLKGRGYILLHPPLAALPYLRDLGASCHQSPNPRIFATTTIPSERWKQISTCRCDQHPWPILRKTQPFLHTQECIAIVCHPLAHSITHCIMALCLCILACNCIVSLHCGMHQMKCRIASMYNGTVLFCVYNDARRMWKGNSNLNFQQLGSRPVGCAVQDAHP